MRRTDRNMPAEMLKNMRLLFFAGILFFSNLAFADNVALTQSEMIVNDSTIACNQGNIIIADSVVAEEGKPVRESLFGDSRRLDTSHFTWGVEAGASIDMTAHDMSTFDLDVILGYKNKIFKTLGVGGGVHRTVQNGTIFIPVYALLRTSFTSRPSLLFMNLRLGYSFSTFEDSPTFGDYNAAIGCGVNLSQSRTAKTYIIASVAYRYYNERHKAYVPKLNTHYIWIAQLQFGVNF